MLKTLGLMGVGVLFVCYVHPALAQSDTTCIAYMEAFANYQAHQKRIHEKHQPTITAAYKRARALESAAYKRKRQLKPPESWDVEIPLPQYDPQVKAAHANQRKELDLATNEYVKALLEIYDGPSSSNNNVMLSLIDGDIRRCRDDGFLMSN
ncbi:MAG: hypothetical protein OXF79_17280 [Chloroflexi bacterium]|nr:hypothetical protein [Chloroflexota bacterium]